MQQLVQQQSSLVYADPAAVAAAEAAKHRIQAAYVIAMQKPRNVEGARQRILDACQRPTFAAKAEYKRPQGKKKNEKGQWVDNLIVGPSIRFAELAIREWGNLLTQTSVVYDDENTRRTQVTVTDLETNAVHSKEFTLQKRVERKNAEDREVIAERVNSYGKKVYIVKATDDEIRNVEASMISKALRNEGMRLIPWDIVEEAIDACRETMSDRDSKDPAGARRQVFDSFATVGVSAEDIAEYLGHAGNRLQPSELDDLRGIYTAISSGETTWKDVLFSSEDDEEEVAKKKVATKKKRKPRAKPAEKKPIAAAGLKEDDNDLDMGEVKPDLNQKVNQNDVDSTKTVDFMDEERSKVPPGGETENATKSPAVPKQKTSADAALLVDFKTLCTEIGEHDVDRYLFKIKGITYDSAKEDPKIAKQCLAQSDLFRRSVKQYIKESGN